MTPGRCLAFLTLSLHCPCLSHILPWSHLRSSHHFQLLSNPHMFSLSVYFPIPWNCHVCLHLLSKPLLPFLSDHLAVRFMTEIETVRWEWPYLFFSMSAMWLAPVLILRLSSWMKYPCFYNRPARPPVHGILSPFHFSVCFLLQLLFLSRIFLLTDHPH